LGKATTSIEIEASPEKVFDFVISDKINDVWKEIAETKWTSERPIGLGSTAHYVGVHKYNKGEEWNAKVTEFVKNKNLTMHLTGANKRSHDETHFYMFEPTVKGTKFTMSMEYKLPYSILGRLLGALGVNRMIEGWLDKMAMNLKKALEA
jgi:ligand-binding SRPBCC domain-containing protein